MTGRPAVFLDRDGTIVADPGYLKDPEKVTLLPGAGAAIAELNAAGRVVVLVTNQSGIGRGRLTEQDYRRVTARLEDVLRPFGARLDAAYHCPHAPELGPCACRKPGVALFAEAAHAHQLDLAASWWVGDRLSDLEPARTLGGRAILVETGQGSSWRDAAYLQHFDIAADLAQAVGRILA